jgi:hypothetical protein
MKDLFPIVVVCHSGYKADEYPKYFFWDTIKFDIEEILDRWYQIEQNTGFPLINYYKVRTTDQKIYILKQEIAEDIWYLWIKGERMDL